MRKGFSAGAAVASKPSSTSSTVGPEYHGVSAPRVTRLTPSRPDTGRNAAAVTCRRVRNVVISAVMALKALSDQSTRSILLTSTATFFTPSIDSMVAWRREFSCTPSRASMTSSAASARAAPVIMFFRNSTWPGASMMT